MLLVGESPAGALSSYVRNFFGNSFQQKDRCPPQERASLRSNGALQRVEWLFARYPHAHIIREKDSICVPASSPSGLGIALMTDANRCTLVLGSWYDDCDCVTTALEYIENALLGRLRVRVDRIGSEPHQWAVERRMPDGSWSEEALMCTLRLRSNGGVTSTYLQNDPPTALPGVA